MQSKSLRGLRGEGERESWQRQYIRNALATITQIATEDKTLAEHLLSAEQALRKAGAYLDAAPPEDTHGQTARMIRDWTQFEGGTIQQQKREEELAADPTLKAMVQAGRSHLNAHPDRTTEDYGVKQAMALAAPKHTAAHQMSALNMLRVEFAERNKKAG